MMFISVALVVFSNIIYNITQKNTPEGANPFGALLVTYITAIVITLVGMFVYKQDGGAAQAFKHVNLTSIGLGFAIVGLEIGYLLMYRAGWQISQGSLVANIALALLLIPIGLIFYKEHLSVVKIAGILMCVGGLYLINR